MMILNQIVAVDVCSRMTKYIAAGIGNPTAISANGFPSVARRDAVCTRMFKSSKSTMNKTKPPGGEEGLPYWNVRIEMLFKESFLQALKTPRLPHDLALSNSYSIDPYTYPDSISEVPLLEHENWQLSKRLY